MLYNKELGGLNDEVVFLEDEEDEDTWRDASGVLEGTRLGVFSKETGEEIKVASPKEPVSIRGRNLSYFTSLVEPRAPKLGGPILN